MSQFQINVPAIDYITMTSKSEQWISLVQSVLDRDHHIYGESRGYGRFEQYKGVRYENGAMWGRGVQNGEPHFLLDMSGSVANAWLYSSSGIEHRGTDRIHIAKCTRIDMQVTFAIPDGWDARYVSGVWKGNGVNARLLEGGDGMDTVYIGSQSSNYFWRVYVKQDSFGNRYLRFELQLKKYDGHSVKAWNEILEGVTLSAIMKAYMPDREAVRVGVPEYDKLIGKWYAVCMDGQYVKPRRVPGGGFMKWLNNQVMPAIIKRGNDHELSHHIREWLSAVVGALGGRVQWLDNDAEDM